MARKHLTYLLICVILASCNSIDQENSHFVVPPTSDNELFSEIPPPPGMIFLQKCSGGCSSTLWVIGKNGQQQQFPFNGEDFSVSHNHQFVAYQKGLDIWMLDLKNGNTNRLTDTSECWERNPSWSPDDTRIIFSGCGSNQLDDVYVVYIEKNGERINLTETSDSQETCMSQDEGHCTITWIDTDTIVFGSGMLDRANRKSFPAQCHTANGECLYYPTMASIADRSLEIIDQNSGIITPPALSPDKKILAYDGGHLIDLSTNEIVTLIPANFNAPLSVKSIPVNNDGPELIHPAWSPDGQKISWICHVSNHGDIGVVVFDLKSWTFDKICIKSGIAYNQCL